MHNSLKINFFNKIWIRNSVYIFSIFFLALAICQAKIPNFFANFSFDEILINQIFLLANNFLLFLIPAIFIDLFTQNQEWNSIGLNLDLYAVRDVFTGFIFAIFGIGIIVAFALIFGAKIVNLEFDLKKILSETFHIFNSATTEELLFRGFIFQNLIRKKNSFFVIIFSSLIFSFAHFLAGDFDFLIFFNTFLAGLVFCLMFLQTKSLWLSISFHFCWNWLIFVVFKQISNINLALEFKTKSSFFYIFSDNISNSDNIFSNLKMLFLGKNGFESGIFCTIILLFLIFLIIKKVKPSFNINAKWFKNNTLN